MTVPLQSIKGGQTLKPPLSAASYFGAQDGFGAVVSNDPDGEASPRGLNISDSSFENNAGGAVAAFNTDVYIRDSRFKYNNGAVYFETSDSERGYDLTVSRGAFYNCVV